MLLIHYILHKIIYRVIIILITLINTYKFEPGKQNSSLYYLVKELRSVEIFGMSTIRNSA